MNLMSLIILCLFFVVETINGQACRLYLYTGSNYRGTRFGAFRIGTWTNRYFSNDAITSARLYARRNVICRAYFYKHSHNGCSGFMQGISTNRWRAIAGDRYLRHNNQLSCVRVRGWRISETAPNLINDPPEEKPISPIGEEPESPNGEPILPEEEPLSPQEPLESIPFETRKWRINYKSPWIIGIGLVLCIILLLNIVFMCYRKYYFKNETIQNGYSSVKFVDDSNSEINC